MRVLLACEESQIVTKEFRNLGHDAFSCDIQDCSGGHPEWHIKGDVIPILEDDWDLIVGFPPCTYLTVTGNRWFNIERYGDKARKRHELRDKAADFFMKIAEAPCDKIAIENPVGVMSTRWRKPDQIINPYLFGDPHQKRTCIWLKGLPELKPTNIVEPEPLVHYKTGKPMPAWYAEVSGKSKKIRSKLRSKTFPGVAKAMAEQWGRNEL